MRSKKRKTARLRRAVLVVLIIAALGGIGYSAYQMFGIQAEYDKGDQLYDQIRQEMAAEPAATVSDAELGNEQADSSKSADLPASASSESVLAQTDEIGEDIDSGFDENGRYLGNDGASPPPVEKPQAASEAEIKQEAAAKPVPVSQVDFTRLQELNPDTVAWITFNDGTIDYPVVQGDNNKFYLTHLFSREYGKAGSIFMEVTNASDFSDKNTLIFGHHMNNGSMFANLEKYQKQDYYEQFPTMELYTPQGDGKVEWFAGYPISAARIPTTFESDEAFMAHVEKARGRSDFQTDVEVGPGDRIVTLVTCTYVWDDARYILLGVIRDGI